MIKYSYITGENLRILDYGCGKGENTIKLIKMGHTLTSVDINPEYESCITQNLNSSEINRFKFICINKDIGWQNIEGKFDIILCTETLEHIKDYKSIIDLFCKSIKRAGMLVISVPTEFSERLFSFIDGNWLTESRHVNVFNRKKLISEFEVRRFYLIDSETKYSEWFFYWFFLKIFRVKHNMGIPLVCNAFHKLLVEIAGKVLNVFLKIKFLHELCDLLFPKSVVLYFKFDGYDT